jgi:hypothetical protein
MLIYKQSTGQFLTESGDFVTSGYSGFGEGRNNPSMQCVPNVGPLPVGLYDVSEPHPTTAHGPFVMTLTPHDFSKMCNRGGFLIHGDSSEHPGQASHGCIVSSFDARRKVDQLLGPVAGYRVLSVVA